MPAQFTSGFDSGFDTGFGPTPLADVGKGHGKKDKKRPMPPPAPVDRGWDKHVELVGARMANNRQQIAEAQWKARTRKVPKMSPDYDRVANKKILPPDYEAVIYRLPEEKRKKK